MALLSPIVLNVRKALASPMGKGVDFSPAAIRTAQAIAAGKRPTEYQKTEALAWMQGKQRYARSVDGSLEKTAWLLRGGDAGFKQFGGAR